MGAVFPFLPYSESVSLFLVESGPKQASASDFIEQQYRNSVKAKGGDNDGCAANTMGGSANDSF